MNAMQRDPSTGFLQSVGGNSNVAFDAAKKVKFLEIARKFQDEFRTMPTITELCETVGIDRVTFERHINADERFKAGWNEVLLRAQDVLVDVMFKNGQRPSGYMDRITWLRRHFPQHWNPEYKVSVNQNVQFFNTLEDKTKDYVDAEIVDTSTRDE